MSASCYTVVSVPDPHVTPARKRVWLVVLSQHVRNTGNPIRSLDWKLSCDIKATPTRHAHARTGRPDMDDANRPFPANVRLLPVGIRGLGIDLNSHPQQCLSLPNKLQLDLSILLSDAASHPSQIHVHKIASSQEGSWPKLWDLALERGVFGTTCIQAVLKLLSLHLHSKNTSPVPDCNISLDTNSPCTHFLSHHSELTISIGDLTDACVHCSDSLFIYG